MIPSASFSPNPHFLGLDCSTQALKAVILDDHLQLVTEIRVDFDSDLPQWGTTNGVYIGKREGEEGSGKGLVRAPVMMYVEALDLVMERLKEADVDFSRIKAISGAAQQHAVLLLSSSYPSICSSPLDPTSSLASQLHPILASPLCSNWQDSSTTPDCAAMESALSQAESLAQAETDAAGGVEDKRDSGFFEPVEEVGMTMARITGSSAHERFSGPQLRKIFRSPGNAGGVTLADTTAQTRPKESEGTGRIAWDATDRICLLSSFLTSVVCADGEVKGIDEADASGMNLYSLPDRRWHPALLQSIISPAATPPSGGGADDPQADLAKLTSMLGEVYTDPYKPCGTVGEWFVRRYGFEKGCFVVPFTGDNPATLLSFSLQPGDAIVSLGTSDTVLLATETYNPNPDYHVFPHPAGDALDGMRRYMGMLCYKNGSLAREYVKDHIKVDAGSVGKTSWAEFNEMVERTPPPSASGDAAAFGFFFPKPEIIPRNVQGVFRFDKELDSNMAALTIEEASATECPPEDARRILESQFLSFKSRIKTLLPSGASLNRIFVTGGASANPVIVRLLASVLNGKVYAAGEGTSQGCAVGGAYRAAWAWQCGHSAEGVNSKMDFAPFVATAKAGRNASGKGAVPDAVVVGEPSKDLAKVYDEVLPLWRELEEEVVEHCREAQGWLQ